MAHRTIGPTTRLERAPARRQAWLVDAAGYHGFLRLSVPGDPANDPDVLWREYQVVAALSSEGYLARAPRAADRRLGVVLYDRIPGE